MSFSDEVTPAVIQTAEVEAPAAPEVPVSSVEEPSGQGQAEAPAPQERKYLDLSEFQDHLVKVKVDGQEIEVPASELPNGYSRQEDYTRKTQELARKANAVVERQRAVEEALEALRGGYEPDYAEPDPWAELESDLDPRVVARMRAQEERLQRQEAFIQQQEYQQAYDAVASRVQQLTTEYGDLVTADELLNEAARLQTPQLELVAEAIAGRKLRARTDAATTAATQRATEDQGRQAAARAAADLSSTSHNVTPPAQGYQGGGGVEGALEAALKQLGLTDADIWGQRVTVA